MTSESARTVLENSKIILRRIREMLFYKKLDWNRISRPLQEDPNKLFNVRHPTIEDYKYNYYVDGKVKTCYDWWYSAILKDAKEKLYFFILAFHPKWSFYRLIQIDMMRRSEKADSLSKSRALGCDFHGKMGYSERDSRIDIWVSKNTSPKSSDKAFARCTIRPGESRVNLKTDNVSLKLKFASLGMPFWINRGREATISPKGDTMSGFYDVSKVEGSLDDNRMETAITGVGINEHLMSFVPPARFWKRVDGIFFCTDKIYCAFWYLENTIEKRRLQYKDGAIFIRSTKEYLIPIDFTIEYLEFDNRRQLPVKIRIIADTTRGKLDARGEALAETEKQLAFRITDGHFVFNDGRILRITNGYGQHALH